MKKMRQIAAMLPIILMTLFAPGLALADMNKSIYLNTIYCLGATETYQSNLAAAGSTFRAEARHAGRVAQALENRGDAMARRSGYSDSEGDTARNRGAATMKGLLPVGGGWSGGSEVPITALRQFQQCVSIVE